MEYQLDNNNIEINAWVTSDRTPVFNCYLYGNNIKNLSIGRRFKVLNNNYNVFNDGNWSLLVSDDNGPTIKRNIIGWVNHEYLIFNEEPLKKYPSNYFRKIIINNGNLKHNNMLQLYKNPFLIDPQKKEAVEKVTFWDTNFACEVKPGKDLILKDHDGKVLLNSGKISQKLSYKSNKYPIINEDSQYYRIGLFSRNSFGIDILFVIDGSRSMTKAFKGTLLGVKNIVHDIIKNCDIYSLEKPRFGLVFYRDQKMHGAIKIVNNNKVKALKDYCSKEIVVKKMGTIEKFLSYLESHIACDSDSTIPESVYRGLIDGIQQCGFKKWNEGDTARLRYVIHIGDSEDNGRGNYSTSDVINLFYNFKINKYIAIDISMPDYLGFYQSINSVTKAYGRLIRRPKDLANEVMKILSNFQEDANKISQQISIPSKGFTGKTNLYSGVIVNYVEGYIKKSSTLKYILISQHELEKVTYFLSSFIDKLYVQNVEDADERNTNLKNIVKILLGENRCVDSNGEEISLGDCNRLRNAIPIKAGFMKYSLHEILNLSAKDQKMVINQAKILLECFRQLLNNKKVNVIKKNNRYNILEDLDVNEDGIVDLEDKYFFRNASSYLAWISISHFDWNIE